MSAEGRIEESGPVDGRVPGFWGATIFCCGFWFTSITVIIAASVVLALVGVLAGDNVKQLLDNTLVSLSVQGGSSILATLTILFLGWLWARRPLGEILPFRRFDYRLVAPVLVLTVGLSIVLSELNIVLQTIAPMPSWLAELMQGYSSNAPATAILFIIVAPLTEECIFRGFFLNGFRKRYSPLVSVVLTAVLFGVIHILPYQIIGAVIIGLILGWLRLKTGSLWPCIMLHAAYNAVVVARGFDVLPLEIPGYTVQSADSTFQPWWFDLTGVSLVAIGLGVMWWLFRSNEEPRLVPNAETR